MAEVRPVERWVEILADVEPEEMRETIARCLSGEISPPLGISKALHAAGNLDRVKVAVELIGSRLSSRGEPEAMRRCREMARSLPRSARSRAGLRAVVRESAEFFRERRTPKETIEACRNLFDRAVKHNEEASVALYSLGDPFTLARATSEVVDYFQRLHLLGPEREIFQIGCGTGRFESAFAGLVRRAVGVDISAHMIEAAKARCADLSNVELLETSGEDLSAFPDSSFDLVYAVETFPYLVEAGPSIVSAHFRDSARNLREGGDLVILGYSYRGSLARDREEVAERASEHGFEVLRNGETPFSLWDGAAFHLRLSTKSQG